MYKVSEFLFLKRKCYYSSPQGFSDLSLYKSTRQQGHFNFIGCFITVTFTLIIALCFLYDKERIPLHFEYDYNTALFSVLLNNLVPQCKIIFSYKLWLIFNTITYYNIYILVHCHNWI